MGRAVAMNTIGRKRRREWVCRRRAGAQRDIINRSREVVSCFFYRLDLLYNRELEIELVEISGLWRERVDLNHRIK